MRGSCLVVVGLVAATLMAGCGGERIAVVPSGKSVSPEVSLPSDVAVIVPAGWVGDLSALVGPEVTRVEVTSVDPSGAVSTVGSVDLSGGSNVNPDAVAANRASALEQLAGLSVPAGPGTGDLLAGARAALESHSDPVRVTTLATGCLDVAGQQLSGVDLSSPQAVSNAADLVESSGVLSMLAGDGDVLVLAGLAGCAQNGVEAHNRVAFGEEICRRTNVACTVRETEVLR